MFSEKITKDKYMLLELLARETFGPDSSIIQALDRIKDAIYETSSAIENKSEPVKDYIWESIKEEEEEEADARAATMADKANEGYKHKKDNLGRKVPGLYSPEGKLDLNNPPKGGSGVVYIKK